jgi:hypothetical protein
VSERECGSLCFPMCHRSPDARTLPLALARLEFRYPSARGVGRPCALQFRDHGGVIAFPGLVSFLVVVQVYEPLVV